MNHLLLGMSVFLASAVEMVEALTIVLAIGVARSWRPALYGAAAALLSLGILIAGFGSTLTLIPAHWLWLFAGTLLTIFGMQWLRSAILRASGLKALHDETATYKKVTAAAKTAKQHDTFDWYAFVVVFKGVLIEGLEVVLIVLGFSTSRGNLATGVWAALAAFVIVAIIGVIVHRPLAKVPENSMKFFVGLALTAFGTYFGAMGLGVIWPHGELSILWLLILYSALSATCVYLLTHAKLRHRYKKGAA